jgi:hypothetical protein
MYIFGVIFDVKRSWFTSLHFFVPLHATILYNIEEETQQKYHEKGVLI